MAIDKILISEILEFLSVMGDHGRSLDRLATEIGIRMEKPNLTVTQVQRALLFARNKGWVQDRCDEWGEEHWFITAAGRNRNMQ